MLRDANDHESTDTNALLTLARDTPGDAPAIAARWALDCADRKVNWMPNRKLLGVRKSLSPKQREIVKAYYIGAAVLLAAAAGFLVFVFVLNRAIDFTRFTF
jgi:hypothetical protein